MRKNEKLLSWGSKLTFPQAQAWAKMPRASSSSWSRSKLVRKVVLSTPPRGQLVVKLLAPRRWLTFRSSSGSCAVESSNAEAGFFKVLCSRCARSVRKAVLSSSASSVLQVVLSSCASSVVKVLRWSCASSVRSWRFAFHFRGIFWGGAFCSGALSKPLRAWPERKCFCFTWLMPPTGLGKIWWRKAGTTVLVTVLSCSGGSWHEWCLLALAKIFFWWLGCPAPCRPLRQSTALFFVLKNASLSTNSIQCEPEKLSSCHQSSA